MRKQIITFVPATIGVVLSIGGLTVSGRDAVADDCILKPNAPSPQGSHWYYRTDRVNNRQCWYLRSDDGQALQGSQEPADTARDTSEDAGADDAQVVDQAPAAAPVKPEVAPRTTRRVTHQTASHAEAVEPASSKPTRSQAPGSDKAATPAQQISGTAPIPYTMPYAAWPWPSEMRSAEPAPTTSIAPVAPVAQKTEAQVTATEAPASDAPAAYDGPKRVVPVRIPVTPTPQIADQSASQVLTERAQNQLQPQGASGIVDDATQHGTGQSAYELLQKSFQRLTAPTAQGTEPDHTAALATSALALLTIGIGILVAARWSRRYQQQGPSDARWEMSDQDLREQDFSERDFSALDMNRQDMNRQDTNRQDTNHQDINHPVMNYEALDEDHVRVHVPRHLDSLDAAIEAVHEVRYAKIMQNEEMMSRLQAQSYPAAAEPPPQTTRYQPPPVEAPRRDSHPPQTASESSVSTHRIEDTLQKMLQEIEAKRRGHSAETPPELVHELPSAMQPPSGADEYGRPKRSRIRQA
jgi:hypothetical protein